MSDTIHYPNGIPIEVCDKFEELALAIAKARYRRYSADAILHRIRWHERIEKENREFKANDHWTAPLARWFMAKHPELPEFFELRVLAAHRGAKEPLEYIDA